MTYMRRLKVLWSWLDGSSPHRSPELKRLYTAGKLVLWEGCQCSLPPQTLLSNPYV